MSEQLRLVFVLVLATVALALGYLVVGAVISNLWDIIKALVAAAGIVLAIVWLGRKA